MNKGFLNWLREVLPDDDAVREQYPLGELIEIYPDLYTDFIKGNDTTFANLYFTNDLADMDCYKEVRAVYDAQHSTLELTQAEITELKQKLARYENPDYVLVLRNSNNHIEDIMNEIIWDKGGFQIHREFNKIVYEAMIEAVEK